MHTWTITKRKTCIIQNHWSCLHLNLKFLQPGEHMLTLLYWWPASAFPRDCNATGQITERQTRQFSPRAAEHGICSPCWLISIGAKCANMFQTGFTVSNGTVHISSSYFVYLLWYYRIWIVFPRNSDTDSASNYGLHMQNSWRVYDFSSKRN